MFIDRYKYIQLGHEHDLITNVTIHYFPSLIESMEEGSHVRKLKRSPVRVKQEDKTRCGPVKYMDLGEGGRCYEASR